MDDIQLNLNLREVNTILSGLSELPFKVSNDLIVKIQTQAQKQVDEKIKSDTP